MLTQLTRYAATHDLVAEPGFAPKTARWAIVGDRAGRLIGLQSLVADVKDPGRTFRKCPDLSQMELVRGGAGTRHFLVDSLDVVALYGPEEPDPKLLAKHAYFVGLLRRAGREALPELLPLADLLDDPETLAILRRDLKERKAKPTDKATVALSDGGLSFPVDSDAWHDWWRAFRKTLGGGTEPATGEAAAVLMRCFASGELVSPLLTHFKISGLVDVGGHSAGDSLASFEREAFQSYGLSQAENAAVSEEQAAAYRAALNHLLRHESQRLVNFRVVPWFSRHVPPEDNPFTWLEGMGEEAREAAAMEKARALLRAIQDGKPEAAELAGNRYYVLVLSGVSGRVMVRDFFEGPFPELVASILAWFDDHAIVRREGGQLAPPPRFVAIQGALVRDLKDFPPPLAATLWRAAVRREPIPRQALALALTRFRADLLKNEPFRTARLGLLKAFHVRRGDSQMTPELNLDHDNPAYHCGRLLAVLAALQYRALGDVGAGVVQRFYASASATPALVLGRLVRTAQFHLDKLDRGLARFHDARIAEVMGKLKSLPRTLSLEEQSLFALGYYQQIADDRKKTTASPNADAAAAAAPEETVHA